MEKSDAEPAVPAVPPKKRRLTRRALLRSLVCGGTALAGGYTTFVETRWLDVVRVTVPVPRLPTAFDGLTIAQLSDFHFGSFTIRAHIRNAVDAALGLRPDLVLLTGDYVSRLTEDEPDLIVAEMGRLAAPEGVWAALGNHDHYNGAKLVEAALTRAGIRVLRNAKGSVTRSGQTLWIAGVDDVLKRRHNLDQALHGVSTDDCAVLLAHEPDFADEAGLDPRVALQLSGHSHGGQVWLPLVGPLRLPPLGRKYPRGLRRVGGAWLYTNRGLGTMGLPIRFNARPELTLLTLTADSLAA